MKYAIQFGAGNIGRGFIGAILSKSGYQVTFSDINELIVNEINRQKKYNVYVKDINSYSETIKNILAVMSNTDEIYEKIIYADIITTAVGPLVLSKIAVIIANGIKKRKEENIQKYLNIIACENMVNATSLLKQEIIKYLDEEEIDYINEFIGFVNCSVDRIVPPIKMDNPIDIVVEDFFEWNVEESEIKGDLSHINGMNIVKVLKAYVERKLFTLNTGHCITAYLGYIKNYQFIHESINDDQISNIVKNSMKESCNGLAKKYEFNINDLYDYIEKIIKRFKNVYLQDEIHRVAREPIRKLSPHDRLIKPMITCYKNNIEPKNLYIAISAALHYDNKNDEQSIELQNYIKNIGLENTIKNICKIDNKIIINNIIENYKRIEEM